MPKLTEELDDSEWELVAACANIFSQNAGTLRNIPEQNIISQLPNDRCKRMFRKLILVEAIAEVAKEHPNMQCIDCVIAQIEEDQTQQYD